ncbi:uncharacterized protein LOC142567911 [Dermacentor variabilis]|uniref:uncharacterized protein LOC142567911 n=1 Tax=Dermacentor variabilis TaxID=34621 RepID=UPI003F5B74BB
MESKSVVSRSSPRLSMTHGFTKKIQEMLMQHLRELALKNGATTSARRSSQTGGSQNLTKPTCELCRSSAMLHQQNENVEDTDHIQCCPFNTTTSNSPLVYPKPRLVDSELLDTSADCSPVAHAKPRQDCSAVLDDVLASLELCSARDKPEPTGRSPQSRSDRKQDKEQLYSNLFMQAMSNPASLNSQQLLQLAQAICHTASLSIEHAELAAKFCHHIALVSDSVFLEGLLNGCLELFERREELMGPLEASKDVPLRWIPYVSFVAKLLVAFKPSDGAGTDAAGDTVYTKDGKTPNGVWSTVQSLAVLLSECFCFILRPPSLGSLAEMECLKSAMMAAGKTMEQADPHLMVVLMSRLRDAFIESTASARSRKVLLQLIELRASGWQLKSSAQQMYYYPPRAFQALKQTSDEGRDATQHT